MVYHTPTQYLAIALPDSADNDYTPTRSRSGSSGCDAGVAVCDSRVQEVATLGQVLHGVSDNGQVVHRVLYAQLLNCVSYTVSGGRRVSGAVCLVECV